MIDKAAVLHVPRSADCYAIKGYGISLRLRVAVGQIRSVKLVYGDPCRWKRRKQVGMNQILAGNEYAWFEVQVFLEDKRYAYYFILETELGTMWQYGEFGLSAIIDPGSHGDRCFHYQYVNDTDIIQPPEWVRNSVFYLIFPDRFCNSGGWGPPEKVTKPDELMGGNIKGIIESLDYLRKLGVQALWLNPVFMAQSYHRYDIIDYRQIDPVFGTKEDFREMVQQAHNRGIRIVLDAVFNHCGSEHPYFQDVIDHGSASLYADWFHIRRFPVDLDENYRLVREKGWDEWFLREDGSNALEYETFAHTPFMPRWKTSKPEVQDYLIDVATYWIREYDIDGWRLDVADEVSADFWRKFRKAVKKVKPDAYIVAETWHDARYWLDGTQFDAVMNYQVGFACETFFAKHESSASSIRSRLSELLMRYTWPINMSMLNLFESHDTDRFLTKSGDDKNSLILSYVFIMTFPGTPLIYYGSEVGMKGCEPHENRLPMVWESASQDEEIHRTVMRLTRIRRENPALREGNFTWIDADDDDVIAYSRSTISSRALVFLNRKSKPVCIPLPTDFQEVIDKETGEEFVEYVSVPGRGFRIVQSH